MKEVYVVLFAPKANTLDNFNLILGAATTLEEARDILISHLDENETIIHVASKDAHYYYYTNLGSYRITKMYV